MNGPNVGVPVTYKGVEIGSVIDILLSVEEVEVERDLCRRITKFEPIPS